MAAARLFPSMPSTHIAIKHHPSDKVIVRLMAKRSARSWDKILKHPTGRSLSPTGADTTFSTETTDRCDHQAG